MTWQDILAIAQRELGIGGMIILGSVLLVYLFIFIGGVWYMIHDVRKFKE